MMIKTTPCDKIDCHKIYGSNHRNPSLRLVTKARGCKVEGQKGDPEVTSHAPGSAKSVRE